jgi:hypothetical protein
MAIIGKILTAIRRVDCRRTDALPLETARYMPKVP